MWFNNTTKNNLTTAGLRSENGAPNAPTRAEPDNAQRANDSSQTTLTTNLNAPIILETNSSSTCQTSGQSEKISFHLKTSIFTRRVTVDSDRMALGLIKQLAVAFVNEIYFQTQYPADTYIGNYIKKHFGNNDTLGSLYDRLVLRKYNPEQESFLPFNSVGDIQPESYITIELSEKQPMVIGLSPVPSSRNMILNSSNASNSNQLKMFHDFKPETFLFPTHCTSCSLLIKGVYRQGYQCSFCKRNYCSKCKNKAESSGDSCISSSTNLTASNSDNNNSPSSNSNNLALGSSAKLDAGHVNMSKRKSASNLLHFNIANPFKSHHNQPASSSHQLLKEERSKGSRGSTGALKPVLQQLDKQRLQEQEQMLTKQTNLSKNNLMVIQNSHLSSSHQNLYLNGKDNSALDLTADIVDTLSDANEIVSKSPNKSHINQLSNSARASIQDLYAIKREQTYHTFVNMDPSQMNEDSASCGVCNKSLKTSSISQITPVCCKICKLQVHGPCQNLALADCMSRVAESSRAAAERKDSPLDSEDRAGIKSSNSNASRDNIRLHRLAPSVKHVKRPDATKPIIEGWLKHFTLSDEQSRKHYWRLDQTDITLYENDVSKRYFKAISVEKITRVMSANSLPKYVREDVLTTSNLIDTRTRGTAKSANNSPAKSAELKSQMNVLFAFELVTGSMYLVQANSESEASKWKETLASIAPMVNKVSDQEVSKIKIPSEKVEDQGEAHKKKSEETIEVANELTTPEPVPLKRLQERPVKIGGTLRHHHTPVHHRQTRTFTDPNRSRLYNRPRITIKLDPMSIPDHFVEGKYLIERDRVKGAGFEELGSGQFGKVYAAISELRAVDAPKGLWSGVPVAIKEISKARFDLRQQAKLKNEANILSRLDHPGVIILERVHDLTDRIYIVMEQLEDDMLEMIVSTEEKRLNERITKFLTYQILEALKYLHAQNIAHCDLKPENVLLVERRSQFPQIKLCDFGFAKIIEDNSFRCSLVGTPAYLAPEVVKGERYNRSVDLWSVGVIVYVSLSGEFPFNEGENIHDQISRANFMYPDKPWAKISDQAKSFINSLLRVNSDKRLTANRAQMDDWIQDYQLWCDLSELEVRVGRRWVTDDADFERWSRYAAEHNLQIPRSAIQLHEELKNE